MDADTVSHDGIRQLEVDAAGNVLKSWTWPNHQRRDDCRR